MLSRAGRHRHRLAPRCGAHHRAIHRGQLLVTGSAASGLLFRHADGRICGGIKPGADLGQACADGCGANAFCAPVRNDGDFLSVHCVNDYWLSMGYRSDTVYETFNFRRVDREWHKVELGDLGRSNDQPLFRILVGSCLGTPPLQALDNVAPDTEQSGWTFELHHDTLMLLATSASMAAGGTSNCGRTYGELAPWLACGSLLDAPRAEDATPSASAPALGYAVRQEGGDGGAARWGMLPEYDVTYPVLAASGGGWRRPERAPTAPTTTPTGSSTARTPTAPRTVARTTRRRATTARTRTRTGSATAPIRIAWRRVRKGARRRPAATARTTITTA